ncbi:MAG TPA: hypothetical protein VF988_03590 [Verrucomicrobiae bacterium]
MARATPPPTPAELVRPNPAQPWRQAIENRGERPGSEVAFDDILGRLLQWAATDPAGALNYVRQHYDPRHRSAFLSALLAQWAAKDGQAALEWVSTNLPHDYTQYDAVLAAIGKADPQGAWSAAQQLAAHEDKSTAQGIYVSALRGILYTGNYAQAVQLVDKLQISGGAEKYDLSSLLAGQWAVYEPAKAAEWALTIPGGDDNLYRQQALVSLGVAWSQSDPEAAANFALQLPAGVTRQNMLATALDSWAAENPCAAATWLNLNPPDPDMDMVVRALASSPKLVDADPNLAITWANTIFNEAIRGQTLNLIMDRWDSRNASANQELSDASSSTANRENTSQ